MITLQFKIEDSKLDLVLSIINSLKDDIVEKYEVCKFQHIDFCKLFYINNQ
jgi:hypothetical protein